ncbi:MAG: RNA polymerase sigma factor, partial [Chlorobia bacterium]|nr:RNA polymerase sigma factor [Fimbriimonadaceae bacterium]
DDRRAEESVGSLPLLAGRGFWGHGAIAGESRRVRAAIHGDRSAFDELVGLHEPEIRRYVSKRIVNESVDDVLQDVWLAAWAALPNFDQRSRFKTWLYGICLHKIRDHYRAIKRVVPSIELDDQIAAKSASGVDAILVVAIPGMLAELTDSQREVLELYYFSQLNLPEISRALNRNLNTVKYQFYRAHSELADMMQEDQK